MSKRIMTTALLAVALPLSALAGEKEDELIAKITTAYGGDAVVNLRSYQVDEEYIAPTTGQGHSPLLDEIGLSRQVLVVDIENNRSVYDTWGRGRGGENQNSTVSDGEHAHTINYPAGTYGEAGNADPHVFAGGTMRTSDAVLVYELNKVKDQATLGEDESYLSRPHHTLTMPFPSSPDLKLFIDAETHLISKMVRVNPQLGNLDYVYSDYKQHNGVTYAASINFFIAGVPNLISTRHELQFNNEYPAENFAIPEGMKEEEERIDASQMLVNKISDRVYHVGQNGGFTMFVDTNIGIVAAGGYPALTDRFARFQEESESYKPLKYQVVTHHHSDHIGGVGEAVTLGAQLVTVDENVETITDGISPTPESRDFFTVGPRTTFGEGKNRVEVYEVSTIHSDSFLVTYVPAEKTIFIADHFGSPYAKAIPVANAGTVDMLSELDRLGLDVKKIATAHNARIFTIADMRASVAAYQPTSCTGGRPVCR